jgi:transketolase
METKTQIRPLSVKSLLAGNPVGSPKYSVPCSVNSESLSFADPRATRALIALMDMGAVIGGAASHYGGPAAFAELMSACHGLFFHEAQRASRPWYELFHFVNDAGHCENGLYALKANYQFAGLDLQSLRKFRSIESILTGHGESHLFPQGVLLSNGPLGSALPQSQGLAMADALSGNTRLTLAAISDGACMEGEAKEALAAIPGFAQKGQLAPYVLIISDNNTKLSGRINQESFSMQPTFASLTALGWKVLQLEDAHQLQKCVDVLAQAFQEAKANPKMPIAIQAKTIKGIGTKKTAESASGGHGFPLKSAKELLAFITEIYGGSPVPEEFISWTNDLIQWEKSLAVQASGNGAGEEKIQTGVSAALIKAAKSGLPIVSLTSDLPGSTGTAAFRKEFPQHSFDVGVAESNMISAAAGFAKAGYIPVVDTFAQFGVTKGALPLTMASLSQAPMICIFSHTGFQDAADGASHQALTYFSMLAGIPHLEVYALTCSEEAEALVGQAVIDYAEKVNQGNIPKTRVFFLGRENFPKNFLPQASYQAGKAQVIYMSPTHLQNRVTILACGSLLRQAVPVIKRLENEGVGVELINPSILNHPDFETIRPAVSRSGGKVLVVEDHQLVGGFGQTFLGALNLSAKEARVKCLAVQGEFGQSAYTADDLYKKHHLDSNSIFRAALQLADLGR